MLRIEIKKVDENCELCDIEIREDGKWVETCVSEPVSEAVRKRNEFMKKRFPKE